MGVLLALASSVCYGLADFAGGVLSRRARSTAIAFAGQLGGLVLCLIAAPLVPATGPAWSDLAWGAASGVGTGTGMLFLYRGLSRGPMSVVVPLSAVGGLALPVLVGVVLLSDRPSVAAWVGILLAPASLWCIARRRAGGGITAGRPAGVGDALLAGAGIALQYLALAQAGTASGIWPVAAGRLAAVATLAPSAINAGRQLRMPIRVWAQAGANGGVAALALVLYLLATHQESVSIAVVLSSLYPAIPVLLGVLVLRERLSAGQLVGLGGAGVAIWCLTA